MNKTTELQYEILQKTNGIRLHHSTTKYIFVDAQISNIILFKVLACFKF